jgi:acyl carrier protein
MSEPGFAASTDPRCAEVVAIFSREVGVAPGLLRPEATLDALEIASLDIVQAIFALEERFDVQIPVVPDRAGSEFTTVGQLLDHVMATLDRTGRRPGAQGTADTHPEPETPASAANGPGLSTGGDAGTDSGA